MDGGLHILFDLNLQDIVLVIQHPTSPSAFAQEEPPDVILPSI